MILPLVMAIANVAAPPADMSHRTVSLTLESDGKLIGAPTVKVGAGETATLRTDRYVLDIRVDDQPLGVRRVATTVKLMRDGRWLTVAAPMFSLMSGHGARVETRDADGIPFRLGVSIADPVAAP